VVAHIHPGHLASQRVARAAGLSPTTAVFDGETRWVARSAESINRAGRSGPCEGAGATESGV
jgi:hypothetical protein